MRKLNIQVADWITEGRLPYEGGDFLVGHCLPANLEAYCKIYHPFRREGGPEPDAFLTWAAVGEKYGVAFDNRTNVNNYSKRLAETSPVRGLLFPQEGHLPADMLAVLLDVLRRFTAGDTVCIFQTPPHSVYKDGNAGDQLVECSFGAVPSYFPRYFTGYLFAPDHSWVVFADTDQAFTLAGGTTALVEALLRSPMEALACAATTEISYIE